MEPVRYIIDANRHWDGFINSISWTYRIVVGTRSPVVLESLKRYTTFDGADRAGKRAVRRVSKELEITE